MKASRWITLKLTLLINIMVGLLQSNKCYLWALNQMDALEKSTGFRERSMWRAR